MVRPLALALLISSQPTIVLAQSPNARPNDQASTTRLLPVSGALTDANGAPLTGVVTVTFTLYAAAENGTGLWSETQQVQADERGRYAVYLGAVTPVPQSAFSQEQARWLGVEVNGHQLPRIMLVAVPYALRAADAETLGGKPLSDFVLTDGNGRRVRPDGTRLDATNVDGTGVPNQIAKWSDADTLSSSILTESFDNRLGVLAPDPTGGGVVDSRFTIRNPDNNTAIGILSPFNQRRFALNTSTDGSWTLYDGVGGAWNAGLSQRDGNLGMGAAPTSFERLRVLRDSPTGTAVTGGFSVTGSTGTGVVGGSFAGTGVHGNTSSGVGVLGSAVSGLAGQFIGNVQVTGTLTKGGGAFQIDHPLDPANKYLQHSFVESPDMLNVYNGNVVLDAKGEAWVMLPDWFEALNRDFRYQLTAIGTPGPNLHVASKVSGNRLRIAGGTAGAEVSWQVTGIRHDAWANANRIPVEHDKPAPERGFYLHPKAFDLPESMLIPSLRVDALLRERQPPK